MHCHVHANFVARFMNSPNDDVAFVAEIKKQNALDFTQVKFS